MAIRLSTAEENETIREFLEQYGTPMGVRTVLGTEGKNPYEVLTGSLKDNEAYLILENSTPGPGNPGAITYILYEIDIEKLKKAEDLIKASKKGRV